MGLSLDEWIENNNLKQLEENIATAICELDDIDSAVRCIMVFIMQEFQLRGISRWRNSW